VYLVLSKDQNILIEKLNKTIKRLGFSSDFTIHRLIESPTQKEVIKIVPLWNLKTLKMKKNIHDGIVKFEAFYNPSLYKEMLNKPNPTILKDTADEIIEQIGLLNSGLNWKKIILIGLILTGVLFGTEYAGYHVLKKQIPKLDLTKAVPEVEFRKIIEWVLKHWNYKPLLEKGAKGIAIVILVLLVIILSILGYFGLGALITYSKLRDLHSLHKVKVAGYNTKLFSKVPTNLVEATFYSQLLENEANTSKAKAIMKLAIDNPKEAIKVLATLFNQNLPQDSQARKNYIGMLKLAYSQLV
jgi:hypothetical protein